MKIKELLGVEKLSNKIDDKSMSDLYAEIRGINVKRMTAISVFVIIFEILMIVFYDIRLISISETISSSMYQYLFLHFIILFIIAIGFIIIQRVFKSKKVLKNKAKIIDSILFIVPILIMVCLALIYSLDQMTTGSISVYSINTIIVGALILQKPPKNIISFSIPYIVFVIGMVLLQTDKQLMISNLINGTIFYICVLVITTFFYYNFYNSILRGILLKKANKKLEELSNIDSLTTLYNRRYLDMILKRELDHMKRYNETCTVLMIDIDNFKKINDTYGHPIGDIVLKEFSQILKNVLRDCDLPLRWGGEEFLLIVFKIDLQNSLLLAERILENIRNNIFEINEEISIKLTASIGISQLSGYSKEHFKIAYSNADKALYKAKNDGKDNVYII